MLSWYDEQARDLPWRRRPTLYGTWISEIMLQQTTVATVAPRWAAFLSRFPDVEALAVADEAAVLAAWSGLGYYRRARHLHRAARQVVADGGQLPRTVAGWRSLPGVGAYASAAIASIGLGLGAAAVDANVRRVLTRWTCASPDQAVQLTPSRLQQLAAAHLDPARPGDWNQALMDLGSGPCVPADPNCKTCPVARWCAAARAGEAAGIGLPAPRRQPVPVSLGALVVEADGQVLLLSASEATVVRARGLGRPVRQGLGGLMAGMRSLPLTPWYPGHGAAVPEALRRGWTAWLRDLGVQVAPDRVGMVRHNITHHRLQVHLWRVGLVAPLALGTWAEPAEPGPVASLVVRCLQRAGLVGRQ